MKYSTVESITKMSNNVKLRLTAEEMYTATQAAVRLATTRRKRALKALQTEKYKNIPTPYAYKETSDYIKKDGTVVSERSWKYETFEVARLEDFNGDRSKWRSANLKNLTKAQLFLNSKSSVLSDWEEYLKEFKNNIFLRTGVNFSRRNFERLWNIFNKAKSLPLWNSSIYSSSQARDEIAFLISSNIGMSEDAILSLFENKLKGKYELETGLDEEERNPLNVISRR